MTVKGTNRPENHFFKSEKSWDEKMWHKNASFISDAASKNSWPQIRNSFVPNEKWNFLQTHVGNFFGKSSSNHRSTEFESSGISRVSSIDFRFESLPVNIHYSSSQLIAKVDQYLIQEAIENGSLDQFGEAKFLENVIVIVSVCDPVHRALSNYLHVTRDVKYKTQFTIQEWNQQWLKGLLGNLF